MRNTIYSLKLLTDMGLWLSLSGPGAASVWEAAVKCSELKRAEIDRKSLVIYGSPPPDPIDVVSSPSPPATVSRPSKLPNFKKTRNTASECDGSPVEIISSMPKPRRIPRTPAFVTHIALMDENAHYLPVKVPILI